MVEEKKLRMVIGGRQEDQLTKRVILLGDDFDRVKFLSMKLQ